MNDLLTPENNNHLPNDSDEYKVAYLKWFNKEKGYGFVTLQKDGCDIFVHISNIKSSGFSELKELTKYLIKIGNSSKDGRKMALHIKEAD